MRIFDVLCCLNISFNKHPLRLFFPIIFFSTVLLLVRSLVDLGLFVVFVLLFVVMNNRFGYFACAYYLDWRFLLLLLLRRFRLLAHEWASLAEQIWLGVVSVKTTKVSLCVQIEKCVVGQVSYFKLQQENHNCRKLQKACLLLQSECIKYGLLTSLWFDWAQSKNLSASFCPTSTLQQTVALDCVP